MFLPLSPFHPLTLSPFHPLHLSTTTYPPTHPPSLPPLNRHTTPVICKSLITNKNTNISLVISTREIYVISL